jgi:hypothetical protein
MGKAHMKRPKKKTEFMSALLLGCGAVVFVCLIVVASVAFVIWRRSNEYLGRPDMLEAGQALQSNPDLEIAGMDPANGTMTIRHKESGKTLTLGSEDIMEGRFDFPNNEGRTEAKASAVGGTEWKAHPLGHERADRP